GLLLIGLPEETRIIEPRAENPFIAMSDCALAIGIGIQHSQEMRRQLPARVLNRKIFLMITHDRDQHFFRQLQKLRIKIPQDYRGKFGEIDDGVEQGLVFAPARTRNRPRSYIECLADLLLSFPATQHLGCRESIYVRRSGARDLYGAVRQNAVSARIVPCAYAIELQR